jgi:hypothetical protein
MIEHRENREKQPEKHKWVPFRSPDNAAEERQVYGLITWQPNTIPFGRELMLDVVGINRWLKLLGVSELVEILAYKADDDEEIQIGSVSRPQNGQVTASAVASSARVRKPELSKFGEASATTPPRILVNFAGIANYAESKFPDRNSAKFNHLYGKLVDQALKGQTRQLLEYNLERLARENPDFLLELFFHVFGLAGSAILEGLVLLSLALEGRLNIGTLTISTAVVGLLPIFSHSLGSGLVLLLDKVPDGINTEAWNRYVQYLTEPQEGLNHLFFPTRVKDYITKPLILSSFFNEKLIKGCSSNN